MKRFHFLLVLFLILSACNSDQDPQQTSTTDMDEVEVPETCEEGELTFVDEEMGDGTEVTSESIAIVNYTGSLEDGTVFNDFDGMPFVMNELIAGMQDGMAGMKEGGRRTITIPPNMAYGTEGSFDRSGTRVIPPCATLLFDVELVAVQAL